LRAVEHIMSAKKSKQQNPGGSRPPRKPARPNWSFEPDVPVYEFFADHDLTQSDGLAEAVAQFRDWLEHDDFVTWEAVVCQEQRLPLTRLQQELLEELDCYGEPDTPLLFINDFPRPSQPWDVLLHELAQRLCLPVPFDPGHPHEDLMFFAWAELEDALAECGEDLSLPPGAQSVVDVVPVALRQQLRLQRCFEDLPIPAELNRNHVGPPAFWIDEFLDDLRDEAAAVAYFNLSLDTLLARIVLSDADRKRLIDRAQKVLRLASPQDPLAEKLKVRMRE